MGGKKPSGDWVVAELAARQHGVVSRRQLLEIGFGPDAIDYRLAAGRFHPVHRGVFSVGHSLISGKGLAMAAVLSSGPGAVLSHRSAAELWNLLAGSRRTMEVTDPGRSRRGRRGVIVHQTRRLAPEDVAAVEGIPVTSVARTLLDLAEVLPKHRLEQAMEQAERLALFDLIAIRELIDRSPGRRGANKLHTLLADAVLEPMSRRELERRFLRFCLKEKLPQPAVNAVAAGYEVDCLWPEARLVVELDSREFHTTTAAFERDRERDAVLQVAGYRVIRVTWRRLKQEPEALAAQLRALLGYAAARPMAEVSVEASVSGARPLST
jgi:very-short-patch-repair endonuclease/predicted transcriptional regulator of viral defense system